MGLILPNRRQMIWQNNLSATPSSTAPGTTLTADASAHVKGAYQTLVTSTYNSRGFWLGIYNTAASGADSSMMIDVAIGGAGSEVVILPEFMCSMRPAGTDGSYWTYWPLFIPKTTTVRARIQSLITVDTCSAVIILDGGMSDGFRTFTKADAYGTNAADSGGTTHTPGNSGAESTDANVGSTLSRNYGAVQLGLGTTGITTINGIFYHWELTDGTNTLAEWYTADNTAETMHGPYPNAPIQVNLASGTQLQVQAEASGTAQAHDVAFYCLY